MLLLLAEESRLHVNYDTNEKWTLQSMIEYTYVLFINETRIDH